MSTIRTGVTTSIATVACALLATGTGHAGGSADLFDYPPPPPVVTLLDGGVVHIEAGPGTPPGASWWCGGATYDPPSYLLAPAGAPLPQDLAFPANATADIDCSSGQNHYRVRLQTLP